MITVIKIQFYRILITPFDIYIIFFCLEIQLNACRMLATKIYLEKSVLIFTQMHEIFVCKCACDGSCWVGRDHLTCLLLKIRHPSPMSLPDTCLTRSSRL